MCLNTFLLILLYIISFVNCNIIDDGKGFESTLDNHPVLEESPVLKLIHLLQTDDWKNALSQLEDFVISNQPSSEVSSICSALGDFYSGINEGTLLGYGSVNLKKAFEYYLKAIQNPFPDIAKAHYMLSFIAYYHPSLVTPEYAPKFKTLRDDQDSLDGMDSIENDPSLQKQNDEPDSLVTPNIPLTLMHHYFGSKGNYSTALISFAYKLYYGHYTVPSCVKALDMYRQAAYQIVSTQKYNPNIKLSTENVRLEVEYNAARSSITDEEDVIHYYQYSADTGNVESQIAMGLIFLQGDIGGLRQDYEKAFHYFHMAAETGHPTAISHLGYMYQNGYGTPRDNVTAKVLYEKAAQLDSAQAQTQLGIIYLNGWGVEQDVEKAKQLFEKAAEKNEAEALLYLGHMAFSGIGVTKSSSRARSLFLNSAQSGNLAALYNLGVMFANGFGGVRASCTNAIVYFRQILELTVLKTASSNAYKFYAKGLYDKALIHYELAADQGDVLSQMNVAWLYEMGIGIYNLGGDDRDKEKIKSEYHRRALEFYMRAAEQRSADAHLKVGDYFYYGWAGQKDVTMAGSYYRVASDLGNVQATFNLGWMHQYGVGIPRDPHLAKRYYDRAMELNYDEAYVPSTLALTTLNVEQYLEPIFTTGQILGYDWDNVLIFFLLVSLFITIIIRQVLLLPY